MKRISLPMTRDSDWAACALAESPDRATPDVLMEDVNAHGLTASLPIVDAVDCGGSPWY
jgi:hypothetical protein